MASPEEALSTLGLSRSSTFRYPDHVGTDDVQNFMIISEYEFQRESRGNDRLNKITSGRSGIGTFKESPNFLGVRSYILYLPPGSIKTQYSADHQSVDIGFFGQTIADNLDGVLADSQRALENRQAGLIGGAADFYSGVGTSIYNRFEGSARSYMENDMGTRFGFNIAEAFSGLLRGANKNPAAVASLSMRKTVNPFTTLVFSGVKKLREHNFTFDFRPHNSAESTEVLSIINHLKSGMLPGLKKNGTIKTEKVKVPIQNQGISSSGQIEYIEKEKVTQDSYRSAFFDYPNIFKVDFFHSGGLRNEKLYKIGQSVLASLNVTYGEDAGQAFFEDTGAPTHIKLDLKFKENFALSRQHIDKGF